jgi:cAMP-specific phosphodiesterase 4
VSSSFCQVKYCFQSSVLRFKWSDIDPNIWLSVAALLVASVGFTGSVDVLDVVGGSMSLLVLLASAAARYGTAANDFRKAAAIFFNCVLTLLGFGLVAGDVCEMQAGHSFWAAISSFGASLLLRSLMQTTSKISTRVTGYIVFYVIGLLVGTLVLLSCASQSVHVYLVWAVSIAAHAVGVLSTLQQAKAESATTETSGPAPAGSTVAKLDSVAAILTHASGFVSAAVASHLRNAKQLLHDARISAQADVVLAAAAAYSSHSTTTASATTSYKSSRNLLDSETTRWLATELQAASTRSFIPQGTRLRDGIIATREHRGESHITNSEKTVDKLNAQDESRSKEGTQQPSTASPQKSLSGDKIRSTLSRMSLKQSSFIVSIAPASTVDLFALTRHRRSSSASGSSHFSPASKPPVTKVVDLSELADIVSDVVDADSSSSDGGTRSTFASQGGVIKSSTEQRLLASRSFYKKPSAQMPPKTGLKRTSSQPGSMGILLRQHSSSEATDSDELMHFLKSTYETDVEYHKTRSLLNTSGSTFAGLPVPTNLQFVVAFSGMDKWKFNVFRAGAQCGARPLACVTAVAMEGMGLLSTLKVPRKVFSAFIIEMERTYSHDVEFPNPYHNSFHAADVVQATHQFLLNSKIGGVLTDLDAAAALIAAAGHDYRHPGVNNTFLVRTSNELALRYNDMAVLENFHAAETFELMSKPQFDVLAELPLFTRRSMRTSIIQCILATDLADGRKFTQQFAERAAFIEVDQLASDHILLMQMCLKCADVGHAARPLSVHEKWSLLVNVEFHSQGDLEKQMKIPISPLCDRDHFNLAKSQLGFVAFVVRPCLQPFADWCEAPEWVDTLNANELHWSNMRTIDAIAASMGQNTGSDDVIVSVTPKR